MSRSSPHGEVAAYDRDNLLPRRAIEHPQSWPDRGSNAAGQRAVPQYVLTARRKKKTKATAHAGPKEGGVRGTAAASCELGLKLRTLRVGATLLGPPPLHAPSKTLSEKQLCGQSLSLALQPITGTSELDRHHARERDDSEGRHGAGQRRPHQDRLVRVEVVLAPRS